MADLYDLLQRPSLDDPLMIVTLEGWVDAGLGAAAAVAALLGTVDTDVLANFDVDSLLDHRARRPVVRIVDGVNTGLMWPEIQLRSGRTSEGRDILFLVGPEPDHQWRAFCTAVAELAGAFGVQLVVGLGAFPAPVPHTRQTRLVATATSAELAHRVGFIPGTIDVPAGVQAGLERRFAELGIPAVGLWARVPHYAAAMPYPEASVVLLEGLAALTGVHADATELRAAAQSTRTRLDELVANSEEHATLVRQLETAVDAEIERPLGSSLPSGDELAAELERFLREENP
ncbi:MAG: PAC2 family protein [Acidimicrobiia bacterium]|nr:PAC2 family protein [Acidimicrobiia bacterium]MBV8985128.1 PAC2 family protein [Acidimicrobiia bacterium]